MGRRIKNRSEGQQHNSYWEHSIQWLTCLVFIAPILFLYEVGQFLLGPGAIRNGADVWLRGLLEHLGLGQFVVLPLLSCGLLFGLHHLSRQRWSFRGDVISGMVCESFAFGVLILLVAQLFCKFAISTANPDATAYAAAIQLSAESSRFARMLSFLGAGIYEELLFRLILLSGCVAVFRRMEIDRKTAIGFAVLSTSLFFAAAHYKLFCTVGLEFTWYSFAFRLLAGALFSILYLRRGLGIVVGTHAVYDILVATFTSG